jgi:hypothetical protein
MADHPLTRNEGATLAGLVITLVVAMCGLNFWLLDSVWDMKDVVTGTQHDVTDMKDRMETFSQLVSKLEDAVNGLQGAKNIGEQLDGIRANLASLRELIEEEKKR